MSKLPKPSHPIFAMLYDHVLASVEPQLEPWRRRVCSQARGRVLELGAGTGLNLRFYDAERVDMLTLLEPDPHMLKRLHRRIEEDAGQRPPVNFLEAPAEAIPADDRSFDTVVFTHVFCTVAQPGRAAAEVVRVLAPEGELRILEHVRGDGRVERLQDWITPVWRWGAAGCHPNRETAKTLEGAGLRWRTLERFAIPGFPSPARPHIFGVAVHASQEEA